MQEPYAIDLKLGGNYWQIGWARPTLDYTTVSPSPLFISPSLPSPFSLPLPLSSFLFPTFPSPHFPPFPSPSPSLRDANLVNISVRYRAADTIIVCISYEDALTANALRVDFAAMFESDVVQKLGSATLVAFTCNEVCISVPPFQLSYPPRLCWSCASYTMSSDFNILDTSFINTQEIQYTISREKRPPFTSFWYWLLSGSTVFGVASLSFLT